MSKTIKSAGFAGAALALTFATVATLAAEPAAAQELTVTARPAVEERVERVSVAGLDLSHSDGVRLLQGRVRAASRRVCEGASLNRFDSAERNCRKAALKAADRTVASLAERARRLAGTANAEAGITTLQTAIRPESE
jgi:UrcA family protein